MINDRQQCLDHGPLNNKVGQYLGLDGYLECVGDPFTHQLERPFGNPPRGTPVLDDLSKREGRNYRHEV
jgi:hypothetical protein